MSYDDPIKRFLNDVRKIVRRVPKAKRVVVSIRLHKVMQDYMRTRDTHLGLEEKERNEKSKITVLGKDVSIDHALHGYDWHLI